MLTHQQKRLLDFIVAKIGAEGVAPTLEQMRVHLELRSKSGMHRMLGQLEGKGFIRRLPKKTRAIEVMRRPGEPSSTSAAVERVALGETAETYVSPKQRAAYRAGMSTAAMLCDAIGAKDAGDEIWRLRSLIHVDKGTADKASEAARKVLSQIEGGAQ